MRSGASEPKIIYQVAYASMSLLELHGEMLVSDQEVVIAVLDHDGHVFAEVVIHEIPEGLWLGGGVGSSGSAGASSGLSRLRPCDVRRDRVTCALRVTVRSLLQAAAALLAQVVAVNTSHKPQATSYEK